MIPHKFPKMDLVTSFFLSGLLQKILRYVSLQDIFNGDVRVKRRKWKDRSFERVKYFFFHYARTGKSRNKMKNKRRKVTLGMGWGSAQQWLKITMSRRDKTRANIAHSLNGSMIITRSFLTAATAFDLWWTQIFWLFLSFSSNNKIHGNACRWLEWDCDSNWKWKHIPIFRVLWPR